MKYWILALTLFMGSFACAQNPTLLSEGSLSTNTLEEQLDMGMVKSNKINTIFVRFCNDGFEEKILTKSLDLAIRPNQKKNICLVLVNQSDQTLTLVSEILSATLNDKGGIACSNNTALTGNVLVTNFDGLDQKITLMPGEQLIKNFSLKTPPTASGLYYGCVAISLDSLQPLSPDSPLYLKIRKAVNMKVSIEGTIYYFQWFDDIFFWIKNNLHILSEIGIIICSFLLLSTLFPLLYKKKKTILKRINHKK